MTVTAENQPLLAELLRQLAHRLNNDAARDIAFRGEIDGRFTTVHEDARRDRRELMERIDRLGTETGQQLKDGFAQIEARLKQVCDKGGNEHAGFKDDIGALAERIDDFETWRLAQEHQAKGAAQVIEGQKSALTWLAQNGAAVAAIVLALIGLFKDDMPRVDVQWGASGTQAR